MRARSEHHRKNPRSCLPSCCIRAWSPIGKNGGCLRLLHPVLGGWHKLCGGETFLRAKKRGAPIFGKPVAGLRLSRFCTGFMATLDSVSWRGSPAPFWVRPDPFLLAFYTNRKCSLQKTLFLYRILLVKVWFVLPYEDGPSHRERL